MTLLCAVLDCPKPYAVVCGHCCRKLCVSHYGNGTSAFCRRCFYEVLSDEAAAEVPA